MIIGSGIDLIETGRVERELARHPFDIDDGIFTQSEIHFCNSGKNNALLYAACFAAKEATLKALAIEVTDLSRFREVELLPGPNGTYDLRLHGYVRSVSQELGVRRFSVGVTTSESLSGALVVLES